MKKSIVLIAAAAGLASAAPASAVTYFLDGTASQNQAETTGSLNIGALSLTAFSYTVRPTSLNNTSQLLDSVLSRTVRGVGACTEGTGNGGQCPQVDTDGPVNEVVRATFGSALRISQLVLKNVDIRNSGSNVPDTLRLYGLSGSSLIAIGFNGSILDLTVPNGGSYSAANGGTATINFVGGPVYQSFYLTSRTDSGDGYSISSITAVPEPATWAMLILGFGIVGTAMRRRFRTRMAHVTA